MKKVLLYPYWLRFWHWTNALLLLVLILTGIDLHFSPSGFLFSSRSFSIIAHNISGILASFLYLYYIILSAISGNLRHYVIKFKGFGKGVSASIKHYLLGIFDRRTNPFNPSPERKFHPLQQLAYILIMFIILPLIIISGWYLFFPGKIPISIFGLQAVASMSSLHHMLGFVIFIFLLLHVYLATTGNTFGELFKSMISGWHLAQEEGEEVEAPDYAASIFLYENKRLFGVVFYNPLTMAGTLIMVITFGLIAVFILYTLFASHPQPYVGIITYVVLPSVMVAGFGVIIVGFLREKRRARWGADYARELPIIDLNIRKHQIDLTAFIIGCFFLVGLSVYGSFKAYEYTDSDEFCGVVCHKVMDPEYTAYNRSAHSKVGCVTCHIGSGTGWYVRSKLSGSYQLYASLADIYPRPILTPLENLRPSAETCEKCHRPEHFYSEKKYEQNFYGSDEKNSHSKIALLMKVGGGSPETGNNSGIHWQMYLKNDITYYATDRQRMNIPVVKSRDRKTGKETVYYLNGKKSAEAMLSEDSKLRHLDCIDCHNRPSHIYRNPNKEVNVAMAYGKIDNSLPFIKMLAVETLENYVSTKETSWKDISSYIYGFYSKNYPNVLKDRKDAIKKSIFAINEIYQGNYFPDMKVDWKKYPINVGHLYSKGCYRCHDGNHVSNEGKVISQDCNICHSIIQQETPFSNGSYFGNNLEFMHPGGAEKPVRIKNCPVCHGVKR